MKLQDIIDMARYSELSSVSIQDNTNAIIAFVNMGLIELYSRFPVKTEEYIVALVDGQTIYPTPTDFLYPIAVYSNITGELRETPMNDEDNPHSVFFPSWNSIEVPTVADHYQISIIYAAKPALLTTADLDTEVELPITLIDPLMHYVGYKGHLGVKSDGQSENNAHWRRFEESCKRALANGVSHTADAMRNINRLTNKGFV